MTERDIILLGFTINHDNGNGEWDRYHYYTYKIANGLSFISNASDEISEGNDWYVEVFNTEPEIRFTRPADVQSLISLLEKHIQKKEI
jgi:hypothetical protein